MPTTPQQRNYWHATVSPSGKITSIHTTVPQAQTAAGSTWAQRYMARTSYPTRPDWRKARLAGWKVQMVKVVAVTALSAAEYARER